MRVAIALSSLALVGLLSGAEPAAAQPAQPAKPAAPPKPAKDAKAEKTCRQQIEDLCPDTVPNTPERRACVKQGFDKLSENCKRQLGAARVGAKPPTAAAKGRLQELVEACSKDHARMVELCQQGQAGGDTMPCLLQHKSEFSEPCQKEIERADEAAKGKQAAAPASGAKPAAAKPPGPSK